MQYKETAWNIVICFVAEDLTEIIIKTRDISAFISVHRNRMSDRKSMVKRHAANHVMHEPIPLQFATQFTSTCIWWYNIGMCIYASVNRVMLGWGNGLSPARCRAITGITIDILWIRPWRTQFGRIGWIRLILNLQSWWYKTFSVAIIASTANDTVVWSPWLWDKMSGNWQTLPNAFFLINTSVFCLRYVHHLLWISSFNKTTLA